VTAGEDCNICASVSNENGFVKIDFADSAGTIIQGVTSRDNRSRDILGNRVGYSLISAIGANTAKCDFGDETYCPSPVLRGLLYRVDDNESCGIVENRKTKISTMPQCATVSGFRIWTGK
jgi:hypothetical protein